MVLEKEYLSATMMALTMVELLAMTMVLTMVDLLGLYLVLKLELGLQMEILLELEKKLDSLTVFLSQHKDAGRIHRVMHYQPHHYFELESKLAMM